MSKRKNEFLLPIEQLWYDTSALALMETYAREGKQGYTSDSNMNPMREAHKEKYRVGMEWHMRWFMGIYKLGDKMDEEHVVAIDFWATMAELGDYETSAEIHACLHDHSISWGPDPPTPWDKNKKNWYINKALSRDPMDWKSPRQKKLSKEARFYLRQALRWTWHIVFEEPK